MPSHLKTLVGLLLGGAVLVTSPTAPAAKHGGHKAAQPSLLAECQGPSALPSPHCGRVPTPAFDGNGGLWLAFSQHGHIYVAGSDDLGKTFDPPVVVNRVPEAIYDDGENRPKIAGGPDGELFVSWTHKTPGRYAGDVRFARSLDGGKGFEAPITVNDDHALISHRFDSMIVDGRGRIHLVWIDKRDLAASKKADRPYAGAALYFAVSEDQGKSFQPNRKLVDHSCECCRIALDLDVNDRVVALWRHVYPVDLRDHAIAWLDDAPIAELPIKASDDGWRVDGCPHHGPDLAIDGQQKAHLVWFSQGEKNRGLSYGRFDLPSGQMDFQQTIDATAAASRPQVVSVGNEVVRAWKVFDGARTRLMVSRSQDRGETWSRPLSVADTEHASDHPQLIARGDQAFASWHTQAEGYRLIPVEMKAAGSRVQ